MRRDIRFAALLTLLAIVALSVELGKIENKFSSVQTYPATVCPGTNTDASATALIPNSKTMGTSIPSIQNKMKMIGTTNFASKKALLVDGGQVTSTSVLKGSSGWYAAVNCSISDGDEWFVGGSASVSSKGTISIVNSGLSSAIVDFKVYSSKASTIISKTVPANSSTYVLVDSLAPGEEAIAVNAITRSGRVSIFFLDNRKSGLRAMGADYVSPAPAPAKTVIIPNIPTTKSKDGQMLRVVVPGTVDANIKATIISSDGSFAPSGLDGISIQSDSVKDINFKPVVADSSYSLRLDSDVPISASVLTSGGGDLIWSTSAPFLTSTSLQLGGLTPLIRLYGSNIDVNLSWIDTRGNKSGKHIVGTDSVAFRPKVGLLRAQFSVTNNSTYGALLVTSGTGSAVLPIAPGSHLESATLPRSDARSINRG
jgi:hypothetical protein